MRLKFRRLPASFAVCRLPPDAPAPAVPAAALFISITRTADELSIVCPLDQVPPNAKCESPWACFKLEGPFPFLLTGVLASFLDPLAERCIPIFAISTFDTDYVLVKEEHAATALEACRLQATSLFPDRPADALGKCQSIGYWEAPAGGEYQFRVRSSRFSVRFRFRHSPFTRQIAPNTAESMHFANPYALIK